MYKRQVQRGEWDRDLGTGEFFSRPRVDRDEMEYVRLDRPALAASPIVQEMLREERERVLDDMVQHAKWQAGITVSEDVAKFVEILAAAIRKEGD